ncbi:hypothetical protein CBF23_002895 [Marinomonas agarivorans]|nr:hypothetical protein CBF23_002895 [Marinomonas agarivorans]
MNKSDHKEHSKAIKTLEQKAVKGNVLSMFQLYENYSTGKNVEAVNKDAAQNYLTEITARLPTLHFKINSINLHEFRGFRNLDIKLHPQITVIIGNNGAGKTNIAESIAKLLSWFNQNLMKSNVSGKRIVESDINVKAETYAQLIGEFQLGAENKLEVSLCAPVLGYSGHIASVVSTSKKVGDMYRRLVEKESVPIPLFAFYSVKRSSVVMPKIASDKTFLDISNSRFNALKDSLEASTQLEDFSRKYIELYNLAENEDSQEVKESRQTINSLDKLIKKRNKEQKLDNASELAQELKLEKEHLQKLIDKQPSKYRNLLKQVNDAINCLVPDVVNFTVDRSTGNQRLLVENFGNQINISQLSQGQKSFVALVGDLALRLVTLNPNLPNALSNHGIVIIDEIELHLHPSWQQEVLYGLQITFPNIQFIVTTHSPQVLSTVDKTCIRQIYLGDNNEPNIKTPEFQTCGVTSASILAQVMETDSIPNNIPQAKLVDSFYTLVAKHKIDEAKQKLIEIEKHFDKEHPITKECSESLAIYELKKKYMQTKE